MTPLKQGHILLKQPLAFHSLYSSKFNLPTFWEIIGNFPRLPFQEWSIFLSQGGDEKKNQNRQKPHSVVLVDMMVENSYSLEVLTVRPRKVAWTQKERLSSNYHFSGAMLNFGSVTAKFAPWKQTLQGLDEGINSSFRTLSRNQRPTSHLFWSFPGKASFISMIHSFESCFTWTELNIRLDRLIIKPYEGGLAKNCGENGPIILGLDYVITKTFQLVGGEKPTHRKICSSNWIPFPQGLGWQ